MCKIVELQEENKYALMRGRGSGVIFVLEDGMHEHAGYSGTDGYARECCVKSKKERIIGKLCEWTCI